MCDNVDRLVLNFFSSGCIDQFDSYTAFENKIIDKSKPLIRKNLPF
jgi:hypothetical protein